MRLLSGVGEGVANGSHIIGTIPHQTRSRSVPDVADTKFAAPFLRSCSLSANVFQGSALGIVPIMCYFIVPFRYECCEDFSAKRYDGSRSLIFA